MSGVYALLSYIRAELTVKGGIAATTATVASGAQTSHMWLDIAYDVTGVVRGLMPVLLVLRFCSCWSCFRAIREPLASGSASSADPRPETC